MISSFGFARFAFFRVAVNFGVVLGEGSVSASTMLSILWSNELSQASLAQAAAQQPPLHMFRPSSPLITFLRHPLLRVGLVEASPHRELNLDPEKKSISYLLTVGGPAFASATSLLNEGPFH